MPTLSLAIQKGGSGKTTTTINLGAALRDLGHSVLLVDNDPQANLTQALGEPEAEHNYYQLWKAAERETDKVKLSEIVLENNGMALLPTSLELADAELELASWLGAEYVLQELLEPLRSQYDYILIDCPPSVGMLTANALVASDYVLMPLPAEVLPMKGVASFSKLMKRIQKKLNPDLKFLGLVLTQFEKRRNIDRKILDELQELYGSKVFDTWIRRAVALVEAQEKGTDIFTYRNSSAVALDYMHLGQEVIKRIKETT